MMPIRSLITKAVATTAIAAAGVIATAVPAHATTGEWAAIAVSIETGNVGVSYYQNSGPAAADAAVAECGARGCQEAVRVANGCAAIAQASNRAWGWAYAKSRSEAESAAQNAAKGRGARTIAWVCSGSYY